MTSLDVVLQIVRCSESPWTMRTIVSCWIGTYWASKFGTKKGSTLFLLMFLWDVASMMFHGVESVLAIFERTRDVCYIGTLLGAHTLISNASHVLSSLDICYHSDTNTKQNISYKLNMFRDVHSHSPLWIPICRSKSRLLVQRCGQWGHWSLRGRVLRAEIWKIMIVIT